MKSRQEATDRQARRAGRSGGARRESAGQAFVKSAARAIGRSPGRRIIRGLLGSIIGGGR